MANNDSAVESLETMLDQLMEEYKKEQTLRQSLKTKLDQVKAIIVKKEHEIFDLQSEFRKKDDLQRGIKICVTDFLIKSIEEKEVVGAGVPCMPADADGQVSHLHLPADLRRCTLSAPAVVPG